MYIVIGFCKCGTTSLTTYFSDNGLHTIHHGDYEVRPRGHTWYVGKIIDRNKKENKKLLSDVPKSIQAFTQIDYQGRNPIIPQLTDVPLFIEQYPNAKFILNIRPVDKWLNSINRWQVGGGTLRQSWIKSELPYLPESVGEKDEEIREWYNGHNKRMKELFIDIPERLFVLDLENINIEKLNEFCDLHNVDKFPWEKRKK